MKFLWLPVSLNAAVFNNAGKFLPDKEFRLKSYLLRFTEVNVLE